MGSPIGWPVGRVETPAEGGVVQFSGDVGDLGLMPQVVGWLGSGWWAGLGFEEASSLGWGVGVDLVAVAVDDHMMVKPAEGGEV